MWLTRILHFLLSIIIIISIIISVLSSDINDNESSRIFTLHLIVAQSNVKKALVGTLFVIYRLQTSRRLFSSSNCEYDLLSEVPVVTAEKVAEEEECAPASR